jgi:hypothetical protein
VSAVVAFLLGAAALCLLVLLERIPDGLGVSPSARVRDAAVTIFLVAASLVLGWRYPIGELVARRRCRGCGGVVPAPSLARPRL